MSLQRLSDKNVAKLNRRLGTTFLKVATRGHPSVVEAVDQDDVHWLVDRVDGAMAPTRGQWHWTSCHR